MLKLFGFAYMQTNQQVYQNIVDSFLEKVEVYISQFHIKEVFFKGKMYLVSHIDYKLPFKENPKKVRDLDIIHLNDTIKYHELSERNLILRFYVGNKMITINYK